jgi:hypothetical protein
MSHYQKAIPKLPMRDFQEAKKFCIEKLGFEIWGEYEPDYLIVGKGEVEIHFFLHTQLDIKNNDAMCYFRVKDIQKLYKDFLERNVSIHPNGQLDLKVWKQYEFSILDSNLNLFTFGEGIEK